MGHENQHQSRMQLSVAGDGLISTVTDPGSFFSSASKSKVGLLFFLFCIKFHNQNCLAAEGCHGSAAEKTDLLSHAFWGGRKMIQMD